ncbi:MAG TPA: PilZ domain-containing protein [Terracidiphilus sp.]
MARPRPSEPLMKRLIRWLCPDQRVANRHTMPPLISYLGTVRSSRTEFKIGDVSVAGFFMITEERWIPGTSFPITLERTDEPGRTLTVKATVVREAEDGIGFSFLPSPEELDNSEYDSSTRVDLTKIALFLKGLPLVQATPEELERAS